MYEGGPTQFWRDIWNSNISSYAKLLDHLDLVPPSEAMNDALRRALTDPLACLEDILLNFLQGSGLPDPLRFEQAKAFFDPIVISQLDSIDDPGFRARMFMWAATGSTSLAAGAKIRVSILLVSSVQSLTPAQVEFATENHPEYGEDNVEMNNAMVREGKISFRTCARQVTIPVTYMLDSAAYGTVDSVKDYEHWLLVEVLNAIAGHSVF